MLVGEIQMGTVAQLMRTLGQAKADALLLLDNDGQTGFMRFEGGEPIAASFQSLEGDDALIALQRFRGGHFALRKRGEGGPLAPRGIAFLATQDTGTRGRLKGWLHEDGYETSVVPFQTQLNRLIELLHPSIVVADCPKEVLGMTCSQVRTTWRSKFRSPPFFLPVREQEGSCRCDVDEGSCVFKPVERSALEQVLGTHRPRDHVPPAIDSLVSEALDEHPSGHRYSGASFGTGGRISAHRRATGADFLRALGVLLFGSAAIWIAVYLMIWR